MLVFVLVLVILFVLSVVYLTKKWKYLYDCNLEYPIGLVTFILGVTLLTSVIVWAVHPSIWRSDIAEFESVKTSIQNARAQGLSDLERVSIQDKIIEWNVWLSRAQYRNKHFWIECIPDEIQNLTPIE